MSKRVLFVCLTLLLAGLLWGWLLLPATGSVPWLAYLGLLPVPVSIGLLLGQSWARPAAAAIFCLIYLLLAAGMVLSFFPGSQAVVAMGWLQFALSAPATMFIFSAMVGCGTGFLHWLLYSPPFEEHLA
ncbi:hypothetical protein [Luteolibacter sp. LG18]|uniref:hypothetical protein n=1 Tax=Luteolibacter sp. LG18 TaxID=2819286 RepID=UPI002B28CECC|nr:hypothetical protein llg_03160 [Luteolibacter sp. LG18]